MSLEVAAGLDKIDSNLSTDRYESFYKSGAIWAKKNYLKNNTYNFDMFYLNLKSEHLTTKTHICSQENLRNNIYLTYF